MSGVLFASCAVQNQSAKFGLTDGNYKLTTSEAKNTVFIENSSDDSLQFFNESKINNKKIFEPIHINYPLSASKESFDLDFITIPFKYRFSEDGIPGQITSELNASIYLGVRKDVYVLSKVPKPSGRSSINTRHYGFSLGAFSGLGNALINSDYTKNQVSREYQGIVLNNGLSFNVAINNFTAGLALGFDHLTDSNKSHWIYDQKPWLGISFGLNLN